MNETLNNIDAADSNPLGGGSSGELGAVARNLAFNVEASEFHDAEKPQRPKEIIVAEIGARAVENIRNILLAKSLEEAKSAKPDKAEVDKLRQELAAATDGTDAEWNSHELFKKSGLLEIGDAAITSLWNFFNAAKNYENGEGEFFNEAKLSTEQILEDLTNPDGDGYARVIGQDGKRYKMRIIAAKKDQAQSAKQLTKISERTDTDADKHFDGAGVYSMKGGMSEYLRYGAFISNNNEKINHLENFNKPLQEALEKAENGDNESDRFRYLTRGSSGGGFGGKKLRFRNMITESDNPERYGVFDGVDSWKIPTADLYSRYNYYQWKKSVGLDDQPENLGDEDTLLDVKKDDAAKKTGLNIKSIESLGNGRLKVTHIIENKKDGKIIEKSFEIPEFLYHFTSVGGLDGILQSGTINKSTKEQLNGTYLLGKENFLGHYGKVSNGQTEQNLIRGIFGQAVKDKNKPLKDQKVGVIKISTRDLLENGKLRVRTQEDFFSIKKKITGTQTQLGYVSDESAPFNYGTYGAWGGRIISLRDIGDPHDDDGKELTDKKEIRALAKKRIEEVKRRLQLGGMSEHDAAQFINDMESKMHQGYGLQGAWDQKLEDNKAIEYIYNQDINLSEIGVQHAIVDLANLLDDNNPPNPIIKNIDEMMSNIGADPRIKINSSYRRTPEVFRNPENVKMSKELVDRILREVAYDSQNKLERAAFLLSPDGGKTITDIHLGGPQIASATSVSPDARPAHNYAAQRGLEIVGYVHSHPDNNYTKLSCSDRSVLSRYPQYTIVPVGGDGGDVHYAEMSIHGQNNTGRKAGYFYMPIVKRPRSGAPPEMTFYLVRRDYNVPNSQTTIEKLDNFML